MEAALWYENQSEGLGQRFNAEVFKALKRLPGDALLYAVRFGDIRRVNFPGFPYGIFYFLDAIKSLSSEFCTERGRRARNWIGGVLPLAEVLCHVVPTDWRRGEKYNFLDDSFRADLHPDLKAGFVPVRKDLANPPFNMSDWGGENLGQDVRCFSLSLPLGERAGVRCRIRSSPVNNANNAWLQHFIHHLPVDVAGFVMANGSMSTQTGSESDVRKALIEAALANAITNI